MKQINETTEKLKDGSKSVRGDLKNGDMTFIEESSRVIYEMGNVELFELGQISMTVQCHSFPEARARRIKILWMLSSTGRTQVTELKARFQALESPFYVARMGSRGKTHRQAQWQQDHYKAMDAKRGAWENNKQTSILCVAK